MTTRVGFGCVALLFAFGFASAQHLPFLETTGSFDPDAGCFPFLPRCFMTGDAIDGDTVVTSYTSPSIGIHTRTPSIWNVQQILTSPDLLQPLSERSPPHRFGFPLAFGGDSLLVGGSSRRYNYKDVIYAFGRMNGTWSHLQTLALQRPEGYYGTTLRNIVMRGDTAAVAGLRYRYQTEEGSFTQIDIYKRQANGLWGRRAAFTPPPDADVLAIDRNVLVLGAAAEAGSGQVFVYESVPAGWRLRATLAAPNPQDGARFGAAAAVSGNRIVVAAPGWVDAAMPNVHGAAFVFERANGVWQFSQEIRHPTTDSIDEIYFAGSVYLEGERMLISRECFEDPAAFTYVYEFRSTWQAVAQLFNPLEWSHIVGLSGSTALANAGVVPYRNATFVYDLPALGTLPGSNAASGLTAISQAHANRRESTHAP